MTASDRSVHPLVFFLKLLYLYPYRRSQARTHAMSQVISASRRTDIPAFYADWFINRLKEGSVAVQQPYSRKLIRVSLEPAELSAIVFWSKNYAPLLGRLEVIEQTTRKLFFHFTITAAQELESSVPGYRDAARDFRFLSRRYSPDRVVWRYDPICLTDKLSFDIYEERFRACADTLRGYADTCIISFVHPYRKVLINLAKYTDHRLTDVPIAQEREYARRLAEIAAPYGIRVRACSNDDLLSDAVKKASCIDGRRLAELFQIQLDTRPASIRKECACTKSVDIGAYDTCAHGCVYCYANADKERALAALRHHDPESAALGMWARGDECSG